MTEADFDLCPECGSFAKFGLRCHPKFSLKVGANLMSADGGDPDMMAFYAHSIEHLRVLFNRFSNDGISMVLSAERWRGDKWVEIDTGKWH